MQKPTEGKAYISEKDNYCGHL